MPVEVAVAVLIRDDGRVLLAKRPVGKVYAGYWEFPGGKVEPGEEVAHALARELREELAIVAVERAYPWITQNYTYPHATVRLHFYRVLRWSGEPHAAEHEALAWEALDGITVAPLLPANGPVLRALGLPNEYAITQAGELGRDRFLERLGHRLDGGLRLIQVREPSYSRAQLTSLAADIVAMAHRAGARVLVNGDVGLAREVGADGVHFTSRQISEAHARPDLPLVGASTHSAEELRAAERLGADFAVLGPVDATPSHPGRMPLGWHAFGQAALDAAIPVYALGGMSPSDMETAWTCGAHGVAMVRAAWEQR